MDNFYLIDYHLHTTFSPDAEGASDEIVKQAIKRGIKEICFTDHWDQGGEEEKFKTYHYAAERQMWQSLRAKYGHQINIKLGIEIGYVREREREIKEFLAAHDFDFVIGSVHHLGKSLISDYNRDDYFQGKSEAEALRPYFAAEMELAKLAGYVSVLGHFDYIKKLGSKFFGRIDFLKYKKEILPIFEQAIKNNIGLELNTSGYVGHVHEPYPSRELLALYRAAGGKIITLGSDGHRFVASEPYKSTYFENLETGAALLTDIGFTEVATFTNKKIQWQKLKQN